jgi:hypothetical protein
MLCAVEQDCTQMYIHADSFATPWLLLFISCTIAMLTLGITRLWSGRTACHPAPNRNTRADVGISKRPGQSAAGCETAARTLISEREKPSLPSLVWPCQHFQSSP